GPVPSFGSGGIEANFVAVLPSQQLIGRDVVRFTCQIPQRHLYGTYTATLASMETKLFDAFENHLDVARVHAKNSALEKERVSPRSAIANFTEPIDALICVDTDNRTPCVTIHYNGVTHVGNFKVSRCRILVDS